MSSLFDLSLEYYALKDLIDNDLEVNEETGEITDNSEVIKNLFEELNLSFEDKLDNSQRYLLTLSGETDVLDKEIKRLQAKKVALKNKADRLKELMKNAIISSGNTKFKTSLYSFNVRTSQAVNIKDEEEIARKYMKVKYEISKTLIKEDLKNGVVVPGAEMLENKSLTVK